MWLPGLLIIAAFLPMSDGGAEGGAVTVPNREQRYFKIKVNKAFYNDLTFACATTFLRILPCGVNVGAVFEQGLSLAR